MFGIEMINPSKGDFIKNKISIEFSKHINRSTVAKNIIIVKDVDRTISCIDTFVSSKKEAVTSEISVNGKSVDIYINNVEKSSRYAVLIRGSIESIDGEKIINDFVSYFYTKQKEDGMYSIYSPVDGEIVKRIDRINFSSTSDMTRIQIATDASFSNIVVSSATNSKTAFCLDSSIDEYGGYYVRIGSNNIWSDAIFVFVDEYVSDIENSDIDSVFIQNSDTENGCTGTLHYTNLPNVCTNFIPSISSRVSITCANICIEFDTVINDIDNFVKTFRLHKLYDNLIEKEVNEEVDIKSISYHIDVINNKTILILDISR